MLWYDAIFPHPNLHYAKYRPNKFFATREKVNESRVVCCPRAVLVQPMSHAWKLDIEEFEDAAPQLAAAAMQGTCDEGSGARGECPIERVGPHTKACTGPVGRYTFSLCGSTPSFWLITACFVLFWLFTLHQISKEMMIALTDWMVMSCARLLFLAAFIKELHEYDDLHCHLYYLIIFIVGSHTGEW